MNKRLRPWVTDWAAVVIAPSPEYQASDIGMVFI